MTEKKDYFILIEKLLFVLVVFPGEISELLADKETEVSLKDSRALSFSGKFESEYSLLIYSRQTHETLNNNQLFHICRSKLALYSLSLLIVPNLLKFWKNKYI